jgi:hypothetical protein
LGLVYLNLGDIEMAVDEQGQLNGRIEEYPAFQLLDKIQYQSRQPDTHY